LTDFIAGRVDINKEREKARRQIFWFKAGELTTLPRTYSVRLSEEMKEASKDHARFLNSRDIPGELKCLPKIATKAVIIQLVSWSICRLTNSNDYSGPPSYDNQRGACPNTFAFLRLIVLS